MKGARGRAGVGNGPRGLLSEDKLSNENFYEDIYQIFNQTRTKDKFTQSYKSRYQSLQWDTEEETNFIHTLFDDLNTPDLISHAKRIFDDNNSEPRFSSFTKNQEIYQIPAPPYMNKDPEIVFTHLIWFRFFFPKDLTNEEKEEERKKINEISKQAHRKSLMIHRAKKEREEPKNLPEVLKKINSRWDPSEEKIKKVIEKYMKYKELDSGEEKIQKEQSKIALKQAINDALKTDTSTLPTIDLTESISAKDALEKKINLALNSQSANPPNPGSEGIEINLVSLGQPMELKSISNEALENILFQNEKMDENNKAQIKMPKIKLKSVEEFKDFLTENGDTNLDERSVNAAFEAYKTYYKEALSLHTSELLKGLKEKAITKVLDREFNGIVSFLDRMPKTELNASLVVHQSSIQMQASGALMDESEPRPEAISDSNIKRDKVAEFEKFLKKIDPNFQITKDNYDEILSQYYKYKEYEEKFKTRKTGTSNLDLISELKKSEKKLKNTIGSCLQLSENTEKNTISSSLQLSRKAKLPTIFENTQPYNPNPYQIEDNEFYKVLNYLKYEQIKNHNEQIKNHNEQNPPPKNKYEHPKSNETLDNLLKSIIEFPNNIPKVFDWIRTNDSKSPKNGQTNKRQ